MMPAETPDVPDIDFPPQFDTTPTPDMETKVWDQLSDADKMDALFNTVCAIGNQVNWIVQQLTMILQAAAHVPGMGGMMMRKAMNQND